TKAGRGQHAWCASISTKCCDLEFGRKLSWDAGDEAKTRKPYDTTCSALLKPAIDSLEFLKI
ncbi:MAG: hypothetical protein AAFV74_21725, partial [Pseudomonadota bacterium]